MRVPRSIHHHPPCRLQRTHRCSLRAANLPSTPSTNTIDQKQVRRRKFHPRNKLGCYLVLALSLVAMVLCTGAAVVDLWGGRS